MTENKKGYHYHHCEQEPSEGVEIVFADFYGDLSNERKWWLHLYHEATEEDIENFEADEVGETISSNAMAISFCPFCGEKLI